MYVSGSKREYTEVEQMFGGGQIPGLEQTETLDWAHSSTTADQVLLNASPSVCQRTCLPACQSLCFQLSEACSPYKVILLRTIKFVLQFEQNCVGS